MHRSCRSLRLPGRRGSTCDEHVPGRLHHLGATLNRTDSHPESGVPAPGITLPLMNRFRSGKTDPLSDRLAAALRKEFDGHGVLTSDKKQDRSARR
jgi:6-phosphogluconate dehydrogenase (decarboxylating)